jgi:hypothetical protein
MAMPRVVAVLAVVVALVAAGVPVATAMPTRCADCCHDGTLRAADASMPDCCRLAPAERDVARATAPQRPAVPRAVAAPPAGMSPGPVLARTHEAPPNRQHCAIRTQVLRL